MPYIVHDEENGRFFHVSLGGPLPEYIDKLRSTATAIKADEPRAPVSGSLEEVIARVEALALEREGDTHAVWRRLNETSMP